MSRRSLVLVLTAATLATASAATAAWMTVNTVAGDAPAPPPRFEVDPAWPKPLPNRWLMGQAAGVAVDRHDHVWVVHVYTTEVDSGKRAQKFVNHGTGR